VFSPPLKKSIVFLKYALKMDLVKGAWFDLYYYLYSSTNYNSIKSRDFNAWWNLPLHWNLKFQVSCVCRDSATTAWC